MKKRNSIMKKVLALMLVVISMFSMVSVGTVNASAKNFISVNTIIGFAKAGSFEKLLKSSITDGIKGGVTAAISPMIKLIGQQYLGLPAETGLSEIMERLDEISAELDEIKAEMSDGFEKILAELDKREKMDSTIKALAEAEFLASIVMNTENLDEAPATLEEIKDLSGEEQKKIIEINADAISYETVSALIKALQKAKAYLSVSGFIDSDYETAYCVYYNYMKKQSMFCGEAALKSAAFWEIMKESYAKSCVALIYALEQQLAMYELSESEPADGIKQEAIDAAAVASTFGTKNVIKNNLKKIKTEAETVLNYYNNFIEDVKEEATVYINKGSCYLKLNPELSVIEFKDLDNYSTYSKSEGFTKGGITKEIYDKTIYDVKDYFYNSGNNYVELDTVSYDEFTSNTGKCTYRYARRSSAGTVYVPKEGNWEKYSNNVFKNVILNAKMVKYNTSNKPEEQVVQNIMNYVTANYSTKTIAEYLTAVGFSFGDCDITEEDTIYMPTSNFTLGNGRLKIGTQGKVYDLASLAKDTSSTFAKSPSGKMFYFNNDEDTISVTIDSIDMDNRIYKGIYTITGKEIVGYEADGTPKYVAYKKVYEVKGDKIMNFRLPTTLDYKTIKITLGYDGLGASSNHENLCTYSLAQLQQAPKEITLRMEGYTKIWLGYGVNAEIFCDGASMVKGKG